MSGAPFSRVAMLGMGLVGGSFALAIRRQFADARIIGWDRPGVLTQAVARGAIHESSTDVVATVRGADLIYLALPIGVTLEVLPAVAGEAGPRALVTDSCSTKTILCKAAAAHLGGSTRFLGGHPIAGKEVSGIEHADPDLFRGTRYALVASEDDPDPRVKQFVELLRAIGAEPAWCDAETHDWAVGIVSHLPQLVSVALGGVVLDETDETGLPISLAGNGLRDSLRLAGSSYEIWRDVCLTNTQNIARALDRVIQALDHLRARLTSRELEDEFHAANELYKILRQLQ